MFNYESMRKLVNSNPILQFSRKAVQVDPVSLSDAFSPSGMSFGLGQTLGHNTDITHVRNVKRHRLFLNMMKFNM